ncbi:hypothetical protein EIN_345900 [Entamoeba invadens IP1]|uniref:Uncharacterized protein n=1 Tax=Entamoeba invadens IP1 TaxID=370355 RepID=L7FLG5_ENTIV|nr:hypothetical protein EIN_345900 [Entamoeba invadens IP1]ELP84004.1 hypothetical protein EIN_345900 [Entamoeba invadens IP1]|eukprot:XP_004183350.1 hypothetical protein EIN_345900 [Entamoeba invadens IP1]
METTTELDEHLFLETYYQTSGCTSKVIEHATKIRLLVTELNNHVYKNPQTKVQLDQLRKEYQSVHSKNDGTVPVDAINTDSAFSQLVDGLKVSQEDVVDFHNDFIDDPSWNDFDRLMANVERKDEPKNQGILEASFLNDYEQKDENTILKEKIGLLEAENEKLKRQLHEIKVFYEKTKAKMSCKSPFCETPAHVPQN